MGCLAKPKGKIANNAHAAIFVSLLKVGNRYILFPHVFAHPALRGMGSTTLELASPVVGLFFPFCAMVGMPSDILSLIFISCEHSTVFNPFSLKSSQTQVYLRLWMSFF